MEVFTRFSNHKKQSKHTISIQLIVCLLCFSPLIPLPGTSIAHADNFPVIGVLHSGSSPEALAVDTQTHIVYIAHESPGVVVGFDPVRGVVRWRVSLGSVVTDVQADSIDHYVFAATMLRGGQGSLSVLDGATGHILYSASTASGDNGLAFDHQRRRVYITDGVHIGMFTFSFSSTQSANGGKVEAQFTSLRVGTQPQALGVNSRLGRLYVADGAENKVTVWDEDHQRILANIPVGAAPIQPLRVDEATGRVYVVCSMGQELDVIDGNRNQVIASPPVSPYPEGVAFNTATGRIYVADEGDRIGGPPHDSGSTVTIIDGKTLDVLGTLAIGAAPDGVEADPSLHRVYVALEKGNAVVELSDSPDLPLATSTHTSQAVAAHQAITTLQWATLLTLIAMLLTIGLATLSALSPRWRERESPRTRPGDASSGSGSHSLPL